MGDQAKTPASDVLRPGALSALLEEIARDVAAVPAAEAPPELRSGAVIDRFEILREVGRGGFGVVYEARDRELGRTVAFKVVRAGNRPEVRERRLLQEAEAAARLSHPNIVTLFDVGRCEQGPYLVMEFLRGRTLADRLDAGQVALLEALRIAIEVAKGVGHAHANGVIHRDLTPGNVFLCDDGQVKVLDFGMAHAFGRLKLEGGTKSYMAPEQARGAPEDERTDVFALGVILYRMVSGQLPFRPAARHPRRAPPLEVGGTPGLGRLVGRMLDRDPVRRPRNAGEVASALAALEGHRGGSFPARTTVRVRKQRRSARRTPPSVAVLPFADMSPGKGQEYFGDGIAEEIINALTRVEGLQVVGRTSSFFFKGKTDDLRTVGRKLGAVAVLEGSVRKVGSKVRIAAQLVNAANGYSLWSETYDRELTDILALEDDIARAVVDALRVRLASGSPVAPSPRRAVAPEVYTAYLMGRQLSRRGTWGRSQKAFEKALALDPGYAPAWAGLAKATLFVSGNLLKNLADIQEGSARAVAAADRAVALDPELGEAYATRGFLRAAVRWDWEGARADLERALRLGPGDAEVHRLYARVLAPVGRLSEAIREAQWATKLDPLDAVAWSTYGRMCEFDGQLERAIQAFDRSLEIEPEQGIAPGCKASALLLLGRPAEALAWARRASSPTPVYRLWATAMATHSLGRAEESRLALDELVARWAESDAYAIAEVFAWRGEREMALEWLERAYRQHDFGMLIVEVDFFFQDLRGDPRFAALLQKMGLPAT